MKRPMCHSWVGELQVSHLYSPNEMVAWRQGGGGVSILAGGAAHECWEELPRFRRNIASPGCQSDNQWRVLGHESLCGLLQVSLAMQGLRWDKGWNVEQFGFNAEKADHCQATLLTSKSMNEPTTAVE